MASIYDYPYYTGPKPWYTTNQPTTLPKSTKSNITKSADDPYYTGVKTLGVSTEASKPKAQTSSTKKTSSSKKPEKYDSQGHITSAYKSYKSSSSSSSKDDSKEAQKELEKQRKEAQKALERQMNEQLGGLESSYNANRSVIQNLMSQLDPTYAQFRQDYEKTMAEQKQKDLNQLTAQFAAYGTGDSEQRNQAQERLYGEYAGNMSDYLQKASQQQSQQMQDYENQMTQLGGEYGRQQADVRAQKYKGLSDVEQLFSQMIQQAKQQQFENNLAMEQMAMQQQKAGISAANKAKPNLYQAATGLKGQGASWGDIAYQLGQQGFDLTPGNENSAALDAIMTGTAPRQSNIISIGNGMLLDKDTGDIFSAY